MPTYTFTVILGEQIKMTENLAEALVAAGCDDGMPGSSCGVASVVFDREGESLEQAVRSAIADVQKTGCRAAWVKIETEDLVGASGIGSEEFTNATEKKGRKISFEERGLDRPRSSSATPDTA